MEKITAEHIRDAIDSLDGARYYGAYSGRYMHGKSCAAVVLENTNDLFELGFLLAEVLEAEEGEIPSITIPTPSIDSLGHEVVVYWRDIEDDGQGREE